MIKATEIRTWNLEGNEPNSEPNGKKTPLLFVTLVRPVDGPPRKAFKISFEAYYEPSEYTLMALGLAIEQEMAIPLFSRNGQNNNSDLSDDEDDHYPLGAQRWDNKNELESAAQAAKDELDKAVPY